MTSCINTDVKADLSAKNFVSSLPQGRDREHLASVTSLVNASEGDCSNPAETRVLFKIEKDVLKIIKTGFDINNPHLLIKKFNKSGNGYGLYISNSIIQFLEINPEIDEVKYVIEDEILNISKAK